jgi:hypothetical protein
MRTLDLLVAVAAGAVISTSSFAANPRSFVATTGSDTNNCQRATPCRSFAVAVANTDAGGEVVALDSGGYGGVTLDKSIALTAPGGVLAAVNGTITVALANATDLVILDGLSIQNAGTGVDVTATGRVELRNLRLRGNGTGINVNSAAGAVIRGSDVDIVGGSYGVYLTATNAGALNVVTFDRLRIDAAYFGIWVGDRTELTVSDCVLSGRSTNSNQNYGALLNQATQAASTTVVTVRNCLVANWYAAFGSPLATGGSGSRLNLHNNTIQRTTVGAFGHPTYLTVSSFGNNAFIEVGSGKSGFAVLTEN